MGQLGTLLKEHPVTSALFLEGGPCIILLGWMWSRLWAGRFSFSVYLALAVFSFVLLLFFVLATGFLLFSRGRRYQVLLSLLALFTAAVALWLLWRAESQRGALIVRVIGGQRPQALSMVRKFPWLLSNLGPRVETLYDKDGNFYAVEDVSSGSWELVPIPESEYNPIPISIPRDGKKEINHLFRKKTGRIHFAAIDQEDIPIFDAQIILSPEPPGFKAGMKTPETVDVEIGTYDIIIRRRGYREASIRRVVVEGDNDPVVSVLALETFPPPVPPSPSPGPVSPTPKPPVSPTPQPISSQTKLSSSETRSAPPKPERRSGCTSDAALVDIPMADALESLGTPKDLDDAIEILEDVRRRCEGTEVEAQARVRLERLKRKKRGN